nr:MAG TPA: hypothetical protein [Caudoviricetes sp.]
MNTKVYNPHTLGKLLEKAKNLTEELASSSLGSPLYISCQELEENIKIYSAESFEEFRPGSLITIGKTAYMKIANGTWIGQSGEFYSQTEFFSLFLRIYSQKTIPGVYCLFFGEEEWVEVEKTEENPAEELNSLEELSEKNGEGIPIWWGDEAYTVTSPSDLNLVVWSHFTDSKEVSYTRKKSSTGSLVWVLSSLGDELQKDFSNAELFELMMERFYKYGDTYHTPHPLVKSNSLS